MRRDEIATGVHSIIEDIEGSGIIDLLRSMFERSARKEAKSDKGGIVRVMRHLILAENDYSETKMQICLDLGIYEVFTSNWWAELLNDDEGAQRTAIHAYQNLNFAKTHLPKLLKLLERQPSAPNTSESELYSARTAELELILPEDVAPSKPERIVKLIEGTIKIHEVFCKIHHEDHSILAISQLDSGSDKSITFVGAISAVKSITGLFSEIFITALALKDRKAQERAKTVAEATKTFALIKSAEDNGEIGKEEAELCRRGMIDGIAALIEVGATTADLAQNTQRFEPRLIMAPEPKLLAAPMDANGRTPSSPSNQAGENDSDISSVLSDEEISALRKLAKRSQNVQGWLNEHEQIEDGNSPQDKTD